MVAIIDSAVSVGLQPYPLTIEVDISSGLPMTTVVGLPDKAVSESKERIRTAIKTSGYEYPLGRITINLAPADLTKAGSGLDLPIALGVLVHEKIAPLPEKGDVFVGELGLTGETRPVTGLLNIVLWAEKTGKKRLFIPEANRQEVIKSSVTVYPIRHLNELVDFLRGNKEIEPVIAVGASGIPRLIDEEFVDFVHIKGQEIAKRALIIAAAGGHNIMLVGDPGTGKTLMARALQGIIPPLSDTELLEVNSIYSAAGLLKNHILMLHRPFRSPHHSASHVSIVGGGAHLRPGEITLAHRGILFLDEFAEFKRETLEAMRQPMEDGVVTIARASGSVTYPAKSMVVAAANPTPHGSNSNAQGLVYADARSKRYREKFSGPIMERFDMVIYVTREETEKHSIGKSSKELYGEVEKARQIQSMRYTNHQLETNSEMGAQHIAQWCPLPQDAKKILDKAVEVYALSMRSIHRILKVARTIADIDGSQDIVLNHLTEALQYRNAGQLK